jgi:hypothetical protein
LLSRATRPAFGSQAQWICHRAKWFDDSRVGDVMFKSANNRCNAKFQMVKIIKPMLSLLVGTLMPGLVSRGLAADEPAGAQPKDPDWIWEKGSVSVGGLVAVFNSTLSLGANNLGVTADAEKLLNLQTELTVFQLNAMYRPGKTRRNQIDFTYAAYHRSGQGVLDEDLVIGDVTLPAGTTLNTVFNFDIMRTTWSYAFLQDDRMRIAAGLGVYVLPLKYSINSSTAGGNGNIEGADVTLPLPTFALRTDFMLSRNLYLTAGLDAMYIQISGFKGSLYDANIALEYRPWEHVGFGFGYTSFSAYVQGSGDSSSYPGANFTGTVDVNYGGLMLYCNFLF